MNCENSMSCIGFVIKDIKKIINADGCPYSDHLECVLENPSPHVAVLISQAMRSLEEAVTFLEMMEEKL